MSCETRETKTSKQKAGNKDQRPELCYSISFNRYIVLFSTLLYYVLAVSSNFNNRKWKKGHSIITTYLLYVSCYIWYTYNTHVKISKSYKGDCTGSAGLLFSLSGTQMLLVFVKYQIQQQKMEKRSLNYL